MKVRCPKCDAKLKVADDKIGLTGRCPKCLEPVPLVPADEPSDTYGLADPVPVPVSAPEPVARPEPARQKAPRPTGTATEEAPKPKKPEAVKKRRKREKTLLERFESLTGWQLALGTVGGIVLLVVLIGGVLQPVLDAFLDNVVYYAPSPAVIPDDKWKPLAFGNGGSVLLPGPPTEGNIILSSTVRMDYIGCKPNADSIFGVASNKDPIPIDKIKMKPADMLNSFCDGFRANVRALGGEEMWRHDIRYESLEGVEMHSRIRSEGARIVHRIFFLNGSLYVLVGGGKGYTDKHPNMQRFLTSFGFPGSPAKAVAANPAQAAPAAPVAAKSQDAANTEIRRGRAIENLRKIGVALHQYVDDRKVFPPPAISATDATPLLSWRVALLPYLGHKGLFDKFKLDEPWDSPHNASLIPQMPDVYGPLLSTLPADAGKTTFCAITGEGTAFEGVEGNPLASFIDGLSHTLMVVEAGTPVPWTRPEEYEFDPAGPLPKLGGHFGSGFLALAGDGMVHFIPDGFDEEKLKKRITRNGAEIGSLDDLKPDKPKPDSAAPKK